MSSIDASQSSFVRPSTDQLTYLFYSGLGLHLCQNTLCFRAVPRHNADSLPKCCWKNTPCHHGKLSVVKLALNGPLGKTEQEVWLQLSQTARELHQVLLPLIV